MPLPQYEEQERAAPIPGVMTQDRASLASMGDGDEVAQAARAAGALAQESSDIFAERAKQARDEVNMGALSGAAAQLSQLQTKLLHDPETGAMNTKGENSFGVYQPTMDKFKKGAAEIAGTLTTPEQKAAFSQHVGSQTTLMDRSLQEHIGVQRQGYVRGNLTAAAEQYANAAEANATTNLQATRTNILLQRRELLKLAQFEGLSGTAAAAFVADQESKTHARVIDMMLARDHYGAAQAYYDALPAGTIRNEEGVHVAKALDIGTTRAEAQKQTMAIFAPKLVEDKEPSSQRVMEVKPTEAETFAAVDAIKDAKLQDEVRGRVRQRWDDVKRIEAEDQNEAIEAAKQYLMPSGKKGGPPPSMDNIPPNVLATLKPASIGKLYALARELRSGEHISTDPDLFHELMQQARDPKTRDDFLKRNLFLDYGKLSISDRNRFEEMQTKLGNEDPRSSSTLSFHERIEKTMLTNEKIAVPARDLRGDDMKRYAQFSLSADARIRSLEADVLKRAANPKEQQEVIDTMMQEKSPETKGWIWKDQLLGGEVLASEVKVPPKLMSEMEIHIKSFGKEASDDKMRRMYRAMLAGNRDLYEKIANE